MKNNGISNSNAKQYLDKVTLGYVSTVNLPCLLSLVTESKNGQLALVYVADVLVQYLSEIRDLFNLVGNITDKQLALFPSVIYEAYGNRMSIEDIHLCFKFVKTGVIKPKTYSKIDIETIHEWFTEYDEMKIDVREKHHSQQKHNDKKLSTESVVSSYAELLVKSKTIDFKAENLKPKTQAEYLLELSETASNMPLADLESLLFEYKHQAETFMKIQYGTYDQVDEHDRKIGALYQEIEILKTAITNKNS